MKFFALALILPALALGQETQPTTGQSTAVRDTVGAMPRLEIPEITIVGKKAITLPFARKGEIFDINIFDAAPPDSSFMIARPNLPLPLGEYNRLQERISSWHASAGGSFGSYGTLNLNGFLGITHNTWD